MDRRNRSGLISVTDALKGGEPHLAVKALGWIPVASAPPDPQVVKGEMMRYLAELAWAPDAILQNPYLVWRVLDQDRLSVSLDSGSARAEIEIGLDREGRIFSVFAPDRPRKEGVASSNDLGAADFPTTEDMRADGYPSRAKWAGSWAEKNSSPGAEN
jgi:hypothetical protein